MSLENIHLMLNQPVLQRAKFTTSVLPAINQRYQLMVNFLACSPTREKELYADIWKRHRMASDPDIRQNARIRNARQLRLVKISPLRFLVSRKAYLLSTQAIE